MIITGHARCVDYVKSKNVPTLVAGGGGYTIRNVARVWCYETAVLVDQHDLPNEIPYHDYYEYFAPSHNLHLTPENMPDENDQSTIDNIRTDLLQTLQNLQGAPSIAMQQVPPLYERIDKKDEANDQDEDRNADISGGGHHKKKPKRKTKKQHGAELYDEVD